MSDKEISARATPQQLMQMKQQIENDMQQLNGSFQNLKLAVQKFNDSKNAVNSLGQQDTEKEIMIPLTSSLYVPGQIDDIEHIIVELGAGYFAEHTIDGASKYCDRKIGFLNDSIKKVGEIIDVKARQLQNIVTELQKRMADMQAQQEKQ